MDDLTKRVVAVLLGLRMLSEGSTYSWNSSRTQSSKTAPIPIRFTAGGELREHDETLYEHHHRRLGSSVGPEDLLDRILAAEKALRAAHGHRDDLSAVPKEPWELRLHVVQNFVGQKAVDVAEQVGMSVSWVRQTRSKAKRDPNTGVEKDLS